MRARERVARPPTRGGERLPANHPPAEFGLSTAAGQDASYKLWTDAALAAGTNGDSFWSLVGLERPGGPWQSTDPMVRA